MSIIKWAAVAVTGLLGLMNLGSLSQGDATDYQRVIGLLLGSAGLVATAALARGSSWARTAGIAVGVTNIAAAIGAGVAGREGWSIGLVVAALSVLLSVFSHRAPARSEVLA